MMGKHYGLFTDRLGCGNRLGSTCGSDDIQGFLHFSVSVQTNVLMTTPYSDYPFFLHNKISELREQGLGYKRISDILNEEGVLTVRGKVFTNSHVHSIIKKKNIREQRLNRKFTTEVSKFKLDYV
jgi:hypothetical protein